MDRKGIIMENYELNIISHHPQFKNKTLRKYKIDGVETIGAWGNEEFSIRFKNNTSFALQVKLSLDGLDLLNGKLASIEPEGNMWSVLPYGILEVSAYPETREGGAALVFTNKENSVAFHLSEDTSHSGIIAAAVYLEGQPNCKPYYFNWYNYPYYQLNYWPITINDFKFNPYETIITSTTSTTNSNIFDDIDSCSLNGGTYTSNSCYSTIDNNSSNFVGIGAGDYKSQHIIYAKSFNKPIFTEFLKIKTIWWDDLIVKLNENSNKEASCPSGFPKDKRLFNLDGVPRVSSLSEINKNNSSKQEYSRF